MSVRDKLLEAIDSGEIVRAIYHGGSQPGLHRDLGPISIVGDKLRARCYQSKAVKTFSLKKIELPENKGGTEGEWSATNNTTARYESIEDVYREHVDQLCNMGWHVQHELNALSLHRLFKNGSPKKTPEISLNFEEFSTELVFNEDFEEIEVTTKRVRPWVVRAKGKDTSSYGKLSKAVETFMGWADQ